MPPVFRYTAVIERIAWALLDLAECDSCIVALGREPQGSFTDIAKVGCFAEAGPTNQSFEDWWRGNPHAGSQPIANLQECSILERRSCHGPAAIAGTVALGPAADVVFVAGWRPAPMDPHEMLVLTHASSVISANIIRFFVQNWEGLETLEAMDLSIPAFLVDPGLHVWSANPPGAQYLRGGGPLHLDRGALAGATAAISANLRSGVERALCTRQTLPTGPMVALQEGEGVGTFAIIRRPAACADASRALILIPHWDAESSARHIARTWRLSGTETHIVAGILKGFPHTENSKATGLTELTLRTYTKRLMAKVGIKRQLDLFKLAALTSRPWL